MRIVDRLRRILRMRITQLATLVALLGVVGYLSFSVKFCVLDLDLFWHLAVGDWIVRHQAVPHTGILTWTVADRPWTAYSWGYEVLLSRAFAWGGLVGMGWYGELLTFAVAYGTYWMLRRLTRRFWLSCLLAFAACYAFLFSMMPRPAFFSMVLFTIVLTLLLEARRTGRMQSLYWLPALFVLWANLHIQFIYGLAVVGLFTAVHLLEDLASYVGRVPALLQAPTLPAMNVVIVFLACFVATCVGPYSFHLYGVILAYSKAKLTYSTIIELQPLSFHHWPHYVELLLVAAAFFVVGWKQKIDLFKLALLVLASLIAFRTMRDAWFVCLCAAACIGDAVYGKADPEPLETPRENVSVAIATALALLLIASYTNFNRRELDRAITGSFPVYAANYLRLHPVPGPLYNDFGWGGFLTWYLPQYPVAIDGRNDLYGDEIDKFANDTQNGEQSYNSDPYLSQSRVVLLPKEAPLSHVLEKDDRFASIYQDQTAIIFVRR